MFASHGIRVCARHKNFLRWCPLPRRTENVLPVTSVQVCNFSQSQVTMGDSKDFLAQRFHGTDKNVWVEFGKLAVEHKALNLGQGFPDFHAPEHFKQALITAVNSSNPLMHQYTRSFGHPRLVDVLAKTFSPLVGHDIDPFQGILVTIGAYESLFCAIQSLINPGDEVIIIEPYFDCYAHMVNGASGVPVFIPLRPQKSGGTSADFKLDPEELASKFNSKTKAILINNPNNPLGKVFTREELTLIADLCKKHDVVAISDEVYEWMTYSGNQHIRLASLPGMWDRTLTIGSAGKTFSVTGWKLGWSYGPAHLIHCLQTVHQNCCYTCPTPIQEAVACSFENELARFESNDCYFKSIVAELEPKRDRLATVLSEVGMKPIIPQGSYFMMTDFSNIDFPFDKKSDETRDYQFVKWLTKTKKLASIPPSAFYSEEHKHLAANLIRFCFIKEDSTLEKAANIFKQWRL